MTRLNQKLRRDKRTIGLLGWFGTGDLGPITAYTTRTGRFVIYPRSPPLEPPTIAQQNRRQKMRDIASAWRALTNTQRSNWLRAARNAHLSIGGYNLFFFWKTSNARETIRTIERQTGITLI